jgi:hypothetical protein
VVSEQDGQRRASANDEQGQAHRPEGGGFAAAGDLSLFVISKLSFAFHAICPCNAHSSAGPAGSVTAPQRDNWSVVRRPSAHRRSWLAPLAVGSDVATPANPFPKEKPTMPQSAQQQSKKSGGRQQRVSEPAVKSAAKPTEDHVYGLVSVLYHALQGAQTYEQYIADAQRASDDELVSFFEQCRTEEQARAARAKQLLVDRTELEDSDDDDDDDDEAEDEEDDDDEE